MAEPKKKPKQITKKGDEITIPSKQDFFDDFEKESEPNHEQGKKEEYKNSDSSSGSKKGSDEK